METEDGNASPTERAVATSEITPMDTSCGGICDEAGSKLVTNASKKQDEKHGAINGVLHNSDNQCNGDDVEAHLCQSDEDDADQGCPNKATPDVSEHDQSGKEKEDGLSSPPDEASDVSKHGQSGKEEEDQGSSPSDEASPDASKHSESDKEEDKGNSPSDEATLLDLSEQSESDKGEEDQGSSQPDKASPDVSKHDQSGKEVEDQGSSPSDEATLPDLSKHNKSDKEEEDQGSSPPDEASPDVSKHGQSGKEEEDQGSSPSDKASPDISKHDQSGKEEEDQGSSPSEKASPDAGKHDQSGKEEEDQASSPSENASPDAGKHEQSGKEEEDQGNLPSEKASDSSKHSECDKQETDQISSPSSPSNKVTSDARTRTCRSCLSYEESENQMDTSEQADELEQFECNKCHKLFSSDSLISQKRAPDKTSKEECPMCDMVFETSELLDDHLLSPESCRKNKANPSSPDTATEIQNLSPVSCANPSESTEKQVTKSDNNNEDVSKLSEQKMQELTLDGSVVDELEDRDQELQRLSEEADSMDESQALEGEIEADKDLAKDETELEEQVSSENKKTSKLKEKELMNTDEPCSSNKLEESSVNAFEETTKDAEPTSPKHNEATGEDQKEEDVKVVDQVFLSKESATEMQPEIICHEIVESPVPVAAIPAAEEVVVEDEPVEKPPAEKPEPIPTSIKPLIAPPPAAIKAAISQEDGSKESKGDVIDITDSNDKGTSEKVSSPAKSDLKETKSTGKSDSGRGNDDKSKDDDDDATKSPAGIKRKFSTGNETLDQDIVEILQDSTKSGGRVTRSMRKPKEDPAKPKEDATKKPNTESKGSQKTTPIKPGRKPDAAGTPSSPKMPSMTCKLATPSNSCDAMEIKGPLPTSSNGSLVLQVPAASVQTGAKFIITIPENKSNNTPAGRYLITVPPTTANPSTRESPQEKQVVLKASPLGGQSSSPTNNLNASSNILDTEPSTTATSEQPQDLDNKVSQIETDAAQKMQLRKTLLVAKQTKKVYVKELEEIDNVIFECPKCKTGFPHMLLVQMHMEDCCHHPPTQKPTLHMRIPTEILLRFYDKEPSQNRQNYKCVCCQEVLSFRRYRVGKYYPTLATHFAKHTSPSVRVVNYTEHSETKKLMDALTVHSKQAVEWIDHMVPPFRLSNQPVSSKTGMLDGFLCTSNKLHQESLLLLEYDSDELDEEIYSMRKKKEPKKKKRGKHVKKDETYVCNWRASIVKEDHNIVEVTEIGTPKSAFPNEIHKSGSLKHSILHSPSKVHSAGKKDSNQKSGKKKKGKSRKDVSKQLFADDVSRRRSPRKGGKEKEFLSLPEKRPRREASLEKDASRTPNKNASSEDDIILLSSEDDTQQSDSQKSAQSKETQVQKKPVTKVGANQTAGRPKPASVQHVPGRRGSVDDESSRGSLASLPGSTTSRTEVGESRVNVQGSKDDKDERPPSRGSSIICLSDSNEEEESSNVPKTPNKTLSKTPNKSLIPQGNTSTKTIMQKAANKSNAAQDNTNKQINVALNVARQSGGIKSNADMQQKDKEAEEVQKKRLVPEAEKDEDDEVTVISDTEEEEEEDGVDLHSDNYDPILLDKHQVKTYFQMSPEEPGIYECSLGGCSSCDCVAESDLFEHLGQHIHVERVHPQKRSKTILFKGRVVPQYLKLTRHQIWAHFCRNIVVDSNMEICDEYMQQYKQCRWGSCKQRVWTKYGRLSHHLRSHLRFTQIDNKRYHKMREMRKMSSSDASKSYQAVLQNISKPRPTNAPVRDTRVRVNDGDEVVCLPEDVILKRYKYGKSPSKNVRGIFSCLACTFSHHLDSSASAVMTVKKLACHLKQHLPLGQNRTCLITPKAMRPSSDASTYATRIRQHVLSSNQDLENVRHLPEGILASCFDLLKMKCVEPAVVDGDGPVLNKDGVLYRCLYSGCLIGVVGEKRSALLKHIKEHRPAAAAVRNDPPRQSKGRYFGQSILLKGYIYSLTN